MRFKIGSASLIVGSKFTVFASFYFVFEGNFPSTSPRGAYIWRGDLTEGFLRYRFGGLYMEGHILGILRHLECEFLCQHHDKQGRIQYLTANGAEMFHISVLVFTRELCNLA